MWFDNHCHLTSAKVEPADAVEAAAAVGVTRLLTVGCTVADSEKAAEIASGFDRVWATAGVHPHDATDGIDGLGELLDHPQVMAVGECGLDYFYEHSPRSTQQDIFERQIVLAQDRSLPLVIHSRDAWDDTFALLDSVGMPDNTVFHCFTGGPAEAEAALERGAVLSFSGIVTFNNADDLRVAATICPADRLMVETDSPYLAPVPLRGRPNQPANVAVVGTYLADLRGVEVDELAASTTETALDFYGLAG